MFVKVFIIGFFYRFWFFYILIYFDNKKYFVRMYMLKVFLFFKKEI